MLSHLCHLHFDISLLFWHYMVVYSLVVLLISFMTTPSSQTLTKGDWKVLSLPYLTKRCDNQILSVKYITYLYLFWIVNSLEALFIIFSHALRVDMFWVSRKGRNSSIVKLLSICSWKGWHYLRYLKLCKEHQGKMPRYMPQTNVGSVNWNGARKALKLNQGPGGLQLLPHPRTMTSSSKWWWRIDDCQLARGQPGWVSHRSESETFWPKSSVWGWCQHNGSLTFWAENRSAVVDHVRRWFGTFWSWSRQLLGTIFNHKQYLAQLYYSWIERNSRHELRTHSHPPKEGKDSLGIFLGFSGISKGIAGGLSPKGQDHQCTV